MSGLDPDLSRVGSPERVITHRMALSDGAEAYRMFDAREDGVMKVVLTP